MCIYNVKVFYELQSAVLLRSAEHPIFFATVTRFFIASRITRFTLTRNIDISSYVDFFTITMNYWAIFSFTKLFSLLPLLSRLRHKSFGDKFHFSLQEIKKNRLLTLLFDRYISRHDGKHNSNEVVMTRNDSDTFNAGLYFYVYLELPSFGKIKQMNLSTGIYCIFTLRSNTFAGIPIDNGFKLSKN